VLFFTSFNEKNKFYSFEKIPQLFAQQDLEDKIETKKFLFSATILVQIEFSENFRVLLIKKEHKNAEDITYDLYLETPS